MLVGHVRTHAACLRGEKMDVSKPKARDRRGLCWGQPDMAVAQKVGGTPKQKPGQWERAHICGPFPGLLLTRAHLIQSSWPGLSRGTRCWFGCSKHKSITGGVCHSKKRARHTHMSHVVLTESHQDTGRRPGPLPCHPIGSSIPRSAG